MLGALQTCREKLTYAAWSRLLCNDNGHTIMSHEKELATLRHALGFVILGPPQSQPRIMEAVASPQCRRGDFVGAVVQAYDIKGHRLTQGKAISLSVFFRFF